MKDLRIVRLPRGQVERGPAGIEPAVSLNDVRDGLGLDFPLRPLSVVDDVEVVQSVRVLVDQRPCEIGIVFLITNLDKRLTSIAESDSEFARRPYGSSIK